VEFHVFVLVLLAAAMHATWNALIKIDGDRFTVVCWLAIVQSTIVLVVAPFLEMPSGVVWFWIILSGALHAAYKIFLSQAYQHGDLSQVYPLARGTAPLLTTLVAFLFLAEDLPKLTVLGILVIGLGIISMAFKGGQPGQRLQTKTIILALCTSLLITSYTTVDGYGARLAVSPHSFFVYMHMVDGVIMISAMVLFRRKTALSVLGQEWKRCALGGFFSVGAYWIAIWAMTKAPIAAVAALRETSVLIAVIIGVVFMKEKLTVWRCAAVAMILFGVVLLRVGS
jgi:drug/metabolite transporter (DMT)-like permease